MKISIIALALLSSIGLATAQKTDTQPVKWPAVDCDKIDYVFNDSLANKTYKLSRFKFYGGKVKKRHANKFRAANDAFLRDNEWIIDEEHLCAYISSPCELKKLEVCAVEIYYDKVYPNHVLASIKFQKRKRK